MAEFAQDVESIGIRVFVPASLLRSSAASRWCSTRTSGARRDWIVIGLIVFGITFLAGSAVLRARVGRLGKLAQIEGPTSPVVQARIRRMITLSRADLMVLFLIIYDMVVKPASGDGWFWVAIAGFAILAGILVRNGLSARLAQRAAEPVREAD